MDLIAFVLALQADGKTSVEIRAAVDQYLEDNPSAIDQAAVEAILDGRLDDIVLEQETQPTAEDNRIWFPTGNGTTVQVPTWEEFTELKSALEDLEEGSLSALGATAGQVPTADGNGSWAWSNAAGGGGSGGVFVVNSVYGENGNYLDKTVGEILAAIDAGKTVYVKTDDSSDDPDYGHTNYTYSFLTGYVYHNNTGTLEEELTYWEFATNNGSYMGSDLTDYPTMND